MHVIFFFLFAGMRKEWIRSEEENNMKRIQSGVNRRIKQTKRPLQVNDLDILVFQNYFL
jgi:hypothetical protein